MTRAGARGRRPDPRRRDHVVFHVDDDTHVENVRYGRGSNLMGCWPRAGRRRRPACRGRLRFVAQVLRAPGASSPRSLSTRRWSERTVIALVMQCATTRSASRAGAACSAWRLTSTQGHGEPNPTYLPAGQCRRAAAAARREPRASGLRRGVAGGGVRRPDDRALPRRRGHLATRPSAASSTRTTGCGATRVCTSSTGPRSRPTSASTRPDDHGAGRAGHVAVAGAGEPDRRPAQGEAYRFVGA